MKQDGVDRDERTIELIEIPMNDARRIVDDRQKAEALAANAEERAKRNRTALGTMWTYVITFARLLKRFVRRDYTAVPWRSVVLIAAALVYFISPIDLIPDFLFGGMVDDVAVIAAVLRAVRGDIDRFMAWERENATAREAS